MQRDGKWRLAPKVGQNPAFIAREVVGGWFITIHHVNYSSAVKDGEKILLSRRSSCGCRRTQRHKNLIQSCIFASAISTPTPKQTTVQCKHLVYGMFHTNTPMQAGDNNNYNSYLWAFFKKNYSVRSGKSWRVWSSFRSCIVLNIDFFPYETYFIQPGTKNLSCFVED